MSGSGKFTEKVRTGDRNRGWQGCGVLGGVRVHIYAGTWGKRGGEAHGVQGLEAGGWTAQESAVRQGLGWSSEWGWGGKWFISDLLLTTPCLYLPFSLKDTPILLLSQCFVFFFTALPNFPKQTNKQTVCSSVSFLMHIFSFSCSCPGTYSSYNSSQTLVQHFNS